MKFSDLKLHPALQANLDKIEFLECTPIQEQAIPILRAGKDVSGLAQTGTGKTGAFLVPLIDRILKAHKPEESVTDSETKPFSEWKRRNYILVLVPTRELCEQVQENAKKFTEGLGISSVAIYGGTTYEKQIAGLKEGVEIVIATPGRFIDLYKDHKADLAQVRAVVFDEADRMFDMGFRDDMKFILKRLPRDRQFLVFSATLNFEVLNVAYEFGAEPIEINISRDQAKAENVKDSILHIGQEDKPKYLLSLLKKINPNQAIIFSNYKHNVERIARFLNLNGVPAMGISSLLTQGQRNRVMAQFRAENEKNILVATDLAARGLDILGVDLVMNFDLPEDPENYVHRIGRTGRAGATGTAYSLVSDRDVESLQRIEDYLGNKVEAIWMDEAELVADMQAFPRDEGRPRPGGGRGFGGRAAGGGGDRGPRQGGGGGRGGEHRDRGGRPGGRGGGDRPRGDRPRGDRPHGGPRDEQQRARPHDGRPQGDRPHGDRPRGDRPQGDRPQGERGQRPNGPAREHHRDRASGRHRDGQQQQGRGGSGGGRPQGQHGQRNQQHGRGDRPHGQQNRHGQRPQHGQRHQGGRPHGGAQSAASNKGIGEKVTGFFKRLFGAKES